MLLFKNILLSFVLASSASLYALGSDDENSVRNKTKPAGASSRPSGTQNRLYPQKIKASAKVGKDGIQNAQKVRKNADPQIRKTGYSKVVAPKPESKKDLFVKVERSEDSHSEKIENNSKIKEDSPSFSSPSNLKNTQNTKSFTEDLPGQQPGDENDSPDCDLYKRGSKEQPSDETSQVLNSSSEQQVNSQNNNFFEQSRNFHQKQEERPVNVLNLQNLSDNQDDFFSKNLVQEGLPGQEKPSEIFLQNLNPYDKTINPENISIVLLKEPEQELLDPLMEQSITFAQEDLMADLMTPPKSQTDPLRGEASSNQKFEINSQLCLKRKNTAPVGLKDKVQTQLSNLFNQQIKLSTSTIQQGGALRQKIETCIHDSQKLLESSVLTVQNWAQDVPGTFWERVKYEFRENRELLWELGKMAGIITGCTITAYAYFSFFHVPTFLPIVKQGESWAQVYNLYQTFCQNTPFDFISLVKNWSWSHASWCYDVSHRLTEAAAYHLDI